MSLLLYIQILQNSNKIDSGVYELWENHKFIL